jgi:hypothetical protein
VKQTVSRVREPVKPTTVSRVREPVNTLLQHQTNHPTDALQCTSTSPAAHEAAPHHRRSPLLPSPPLPPLVPHPMAAPASTMPAKMRTAQYDAYGGGAAGLKVTNRARAAVHITLSSSPFPFFPTSVAGLVGVMVRMHGRIRQSIGGLISLLLLVSYRWIWWGLQRVSQGGNR